MPEALTADQLTYEWLSNNGQTYTDHIQHFRKMFAACDIPMRCFLEWGCGLSTKIFLDNSEHVVSVEFVETDSKVASGWFRRCQELFAAVTNWTAILEISSRAVWKANAYQTSQHRDYALIDPSYLHELDAYIKRLQQQHDLTVSFVDSGIYIRGDLVELSLQNKIPIVVAHDTQNAYTDATCTELSYTGVNQYGWFKVKPHEDYERIFVPKGAGTTFWVRRDLPRLIAALTQYAAGMR